MSAEVERSTTASPAVPGEEAQQPSEMSNSQVAAASPDGSPSKENGDGTNGGSPADSLITDAMRREEEKLHRQTMREEEEQKRRALEELATKELREQRYRRLTFLLNKSNMYTKYLVGRMESQAEEEKKKEGRKQKKMQNAAAKGQAEPTRASDRNKQTSGTNGEVEDKIQSSQSSQESGDGTRKGRGRGRKSTQEEDSQGSTGSKRGRKRKAPADNYKLTDLLPTVISQNKKIKVEPGVEVKSEDDVKPITSVKQEDIKTENVKTEDIKDVKTEDDKDVKDVKTEDIQEAPQGEADNQSIEQPYFFTGGSLRPYQVEGVKWLTLLYENGVNGILADEMGLGKTIQCIAAISFLVKRSVTGPFLIIGPLSTVPNWVAEFQKFAPKLPVILYHGTKDERMTLRSKIRKRHQIEADVSMCPAVVTSYEMAMNDRRFLMNNDWKYIIVDEGHRIKNFQCKLIKELKMYRSVHRLLLTGTPLQNNLSELWSLLNFLLPEIFDDLSSFEAWFNVDDLRSDDVDEEIVAQEQKKNILSMLHQILTPFMLRRLKSDVELLVPPKREVLVYAPLSKKQEELYQMTVNKTIHNMIAAKKAVPKDTSVDLKTTGRGKRKSKKINYALYMETEEDEALRKEVGTTDDALNRAESDDVDEWVDSVVSEQDDNNNKESEEQAPATSWKRIKLRNTMMLLKKICNHPYLVEYPYIENTDQLKIDDDLIFHSGKFMLIDKMLPKLKSEGSKVLIFSQMVTILDLLADFCDLKGYKFGRLDGTMKLDERRDQIATFNTDPDVFVFLVSTRAGGLGVNLTAADTVIIFDSDWNPQCDLQAQDRAHRIGQTRPVMVYRMVAGNTIDQKIVERARAKRKLEKMVIHKGRFKRGLDSFTEELQPIKPDELLNLLRSSDFHTVVGKEDEVISDVDLEQLLDRSELYRQWEDKKLAKAQGDTVKPSRSPRKKSATNLVQEVKGVFKIMDDDPSFESGGLEGVGGDDKS